MRGSGESCGGCYSRSEKRGADAKVAGAINQMRDLHRNPLIHPEQVLTEAEAQTLLGIAQSVIVAIVQEIEKQKAASAVSASVASALAVAPTSARP